MDKELLNKIRNAYETEDPSLGLLLKEAGFSEKQLNQLRDAYEKEDDKAFGSIILSGPTKVLTDSEKQAIEDSKYIEEHGQEAFNQKIQEEAKLKQAQEKERIFYEEFAKDYPGESHQQILERIAQYRAGFPKQAELAKEGAPGYEQWLAGIGDIMSAPGRVLRAGLLPSDDEGFLEHMSETEPTSDNFLGRVGESVLQSPSTIPFIAASPATIPGLIMAGSTAGITDEMYSPGESDWVDYTISGTLGAGAPLAGKYVASKLPGLTKELFNKLSPDMQSQYSKVLQQLDGVDPVSNPKLYKKLNSKKVNIEKYVKEPGLLEKKGFLKKSEPELTTYEKYVGKGDGVSGFDKAAYTTEKLLKKGTKAVKKKLEPIKIPEPVKQTFSTLGNVGLEGTKRSMPLGVVALPEASHRVPADELEERKRVAEYILQLGNTMNP